MMENKIEQEIENSAKNPARNYNERIIDLYGNKPDGTSEFIRTIKFDSELTPLSISNHILELNKNYHMAGDCHVYISLGPENSFYLVEEDQKIMPAGHYKVNIWNVKPEEVPLYFESAVMRYLFLQSNKIHTLRDFAALPEEERKRLMSLDK